MVSSIVLAEDNLEHCFFFGRALKEVAPRVSFSAVHDGDKLVQLLESYLPDLLFLDLGMPCKNGVQCIKDIREQREYDSMPIVVFSINDDEKAIQSAYGFGANLYIVKPDEYASLKAVLQKVLTMNWDDPKAITDQYFTRSKYVPFSIA